MRAKILLISLLVMLTFSAKAVQTATVAPNYQNAQYAPAVVLPPEPEEKTGGDNQLVALLLAIFLGEYGLHMFYLGYKNLGWRRFALLFGSIALMFGGMLIAAIPELAILGISVTMLGFLGLLYAEILKWIDVIKILTQDLKPIGGYKYTI